jgi:hypothetical protein
VGYLCSLKRWHQRRGIKQVRREALLLLDRQANQLAILDDFARGFLSRSNHEVANTTTL